MKNQEAKALLERYRNNRCTEEELNLLYSWYVLHNAEQPDSLSYSDWISLMDMQLTDRSVNRKIIRRKQIAVAASLVLFLRQVCFIIIEDSRLPFRKTIL
ncbi:hypothetical protein HMPREF0765_4587 [Sphingobacterium spiritivorum ATCC 33300]|uniref:Uncharacterized protein n=1 Tax=Sphingobacterium spiritivorum ATCC 33300 TaxID=525372 RepID=C2G4T1_SPHSI|nr:hypothetical protein [Sphingobacterium spiritivorum]EEI89682.1 hypothetical protein HMPREF0765_4587 [Sphingobacterium spiritivorum ATCC 33300]